MALKGAIFGTDQVMLSMLVAMKSEKSSTAWFRHAVTKVGRRRKAKKSPVNP